MSNTAGMLLSGSLAFLALLPAALSVMMGTYQTIRLNGTPRNKLESMRSLIHIICLTIGLCTIGYFASLNAAVGYLQKPLIGGSITSTEIAAGVLSLAVLAVTFSLPLYTKRFFEQVDDDYTPISDISL